MCDYLMKHGSNPNNIICNKKQHTTMLAASYLGNLSMMKCLLNENKQYKYTFDWVKCLSLCIFCSL